MGRRESPSIAFDEMDRGHGARSKARTWTRSGLCGSNARRRAWLNSQSGDAVRPPTGVVGATAAKLLGRAPGRQIKDALHRFRQIMEAGEAITT